MRLETLCDMEFNHTVSSSVIQLGFSRTTSSSSSLCQAATIVAAFFICLLTKQILVNKKGSSLYKRDEPMKRSK